jgi:hypothetical protein
MKKILFLSLFTACVHAPDIPADVLPKEKMTAMLIEIHIAEAKASMYGFRSQDSTNEMQKILERGVFKTFAVDSVAYYRSYRFYAANAIYLEEIYTRVADTLVAREQRFQQAQAQPAKAPPAYKPSEKRDSTASKLLNKIRKK